jgi:hypothetical protein
MQLLAAQARSLQLTLGKLSGGMGPENRLASLVAWSVQLSSSLSMASSQVAKGAPPDGVEREIRRRAPDEIQRRTAARQP